MKNKYILISLVILSLFLAIYSYFSLPNMVVMQISFSNSYNYMPKNIALLIPLFIVLSSLVLYYINYNNKYKKWFILSIIGIGMQVVTLIFNIIYK